MQDTIKPATKRIQLSLADWIEIGTNKFGPDTTRWKFRCPSCGGVQSFSDFIENNVPKPDGKFYFSCIGRWVKGRGCDWTLGGLLKIHNTEVLTEEHDIVPVFDLE